MNRIKVKINVSRILKEYLFEGRNGKYLDLVMWPNDQPDQFGNEYSVQQDIPREVRESGTKAPYVGSGKIMGGGGKQSAPGASSGQGRPGSYAPPQNRPGSAPQVEDDDGFDSIPF